MHTLDEVAYAIPCASEQLSQSYNPLLRPRVKVAIRSSDCPSKESSFAEGEDSGS